MPRPDAGPVLDGSAQHGHTEKGLQPSTKQLLAEIDALLEAKLSQKWQVMEESFRAILAEELRTSHTTASSEDELPKSSLSPSKQRTFISDKDVDVVTGAKSDAQRMKDAQEIAQQKMQSQYDNKGNEVPPTMMENIVESDAFGVVFATLVLVNTCVIGVEVQYAAARLGSNERDPVYFVVLRIFFIIVFVIELFMRLLAHGRKAFGHKHRNWILFDIFLVTLSIPEFVMDVMSLAGLDGSFVIKFAPLRISRLLKILRVAKAMRAPNLIRFFRSLQVIFVSIASTVRSLVWTFALLFIVVYVFGIWCVQTVVDSVDSEGYQRVRDENPRLFEFWGDLVTGMLTLFMSVSGGLSWYDCLAPLEKQAPGVRYIFLLYIFFSVFCLLNVVTGVFCNSAIESAAQDPSLKSYNMSQETTRLKEQIVSFFNAMDSDGSGHITVKEFQLALEEPSMHTIFESIGLGIGEAWEIFKLIDSDESNTVETAEFVEGCLKLKGGSSEVDMALLRGDVGKILKISAEILKENHKILQYRR